MPCFPRVYLGFCKFYHFDYSRLILSNNLFIISTNKKPVNQTQISSPLHTKIMTTKNSSHVTKQQMRSCIYR